MAMVPRGDEGIQQSAINLQIPSQQINQDLEQAAVNLADAKIGAMRHAHRARMDQGVTSFIQEQSGLDPHAVGGQLAGLYLEGQRQALAGFLWRLALIGGGVSIAAVLAGVEIVLAPAIAIVMSPVCIWLTLRNHEIQ